LACIRFEIVMRLSMKRPPLVFAQMCVKTKKANVSGLPRPRARRSRAAWRPNSSGVFSGCSSSANFANRSRRSRRNRSVRASVGAWNDEDDLQRLLAGLA
jgi:hypothetical protein